MVDTIGARDVGIGARTADPITAEVVRSAMETVCFEMATYVSRTATTPILNQSNERNATILTAGGELAALSVGVPQFMLTSTLPVQFALEFFGDELYPGDVIVANDPYHGGGHLPDFNVFAPVFDGDRLVLIASIQCHHGDTGGAMAGGYNVNAADIWSEGVRYPSLKIFEAGRERRDVVHLMRTNNRLPGFVGDLRSQVGAAQLGVRRLEEIIERYGADTVLGSVEANIADTARRFHEEIASWPDGTYEADAYVDNDPVGNEDLLVHVAVTVEGDHLTVDFTGSDARQEIQGWSTYGNTRGYVIAQLASLVDSSIPKNEGFFECITLVIPEGTCVNPVVGKPVSSGTHHPGVEVGDAIALALSQIIPDRCTPQTYKIGAPRQMWGDRNPRAHDRPFFDGGGELYAGWCGAVRDVDGWGAQNASFGNLIKATAEINETIYPSMIRGREYITDSGGAGQWRGLPGSHFIKEVLVPTYVSQYMVNRRHIHPGIHGGHTGTGDHCYLHVSPEDALAADWDTRKEQAFEVIVNASAQLLEAGECLVYDFGGGGGWGDPLDREMDAVLDDVWDELVSIEGAARDYGVVVTGSLDGMDLAVDADATARLRDQMSAPRVADAGYRIGVDVGGTFTDLVLAHGDGSIRLEKSPTTPADQSDGVLAGLGLLATGEGLSLADLLANTVTIVHGTTTGDNTMIQMNGARAGLICSQGFHDEMDIRRGYKEDIWDAALPAPEPIVRRRVRLAVPERIDADGNVVVPLDEEAVRKATARLRAFGVESIAISFLHSFVNPAHEDRAREIVRDEFPDVALVTVSHEVLPRAPEFERTSTAVVNAYVGPVIANYVRRLEQRLRDAGLGGDLLIARSNGGICLPSVIEQRAVATIGSGPTGGAVAAATAARAAGLGDVVSVDMGGTSYDVCLVHGGRPEVKTEWNWRHRYLIQLPMVDVQSVGAGGGSIARLAGERLLVGPQSAGAVPGPVCYGLGGTEPTVTDADLVLGRIDPSRFAAGRRALDVDGATAALERLGRPLRLSAVEAASAVVDVIDAYMADAVRRVLALAGGDARAMSLVAFGGMGPVHATTQAAALGMRQCLVPLAASGLSALGLLMADQVVDESRALLSPSADVDLGALTDAAEQLDAIAAAELREGGVPDDRIEREWYLNMVFPGQTFDVSIPFERTPGTPVSPEAFRAAVDEFHRRNAEARLIESRAEEPLVRGVRLVAIGRTPHPDLAPPQAPDVASASGRRAVFMGAEWVDADIVDVAEVVPGGALVVGPAVIELAFSSLVLRPGDTARAVDGSGDVLVDLGR